jgi:Ner family transcriptional regulator
MIGLSMSELSRRHYPNRQTLSVALYRKWPRGERLIARAIGVDPSEIWPSRYAHGASKTQGTHNVRI